MTLALPLAEVSTWWPSVVSVPALSSSLFVGLLCRYPPSSYPLDFSEPPACVQQRWTLRATVRKSWISLDKTAGSQFLFLNFILSLIKVTVFSSL